MLPASLSITVVLAALCLGLFVVIRPAQRSVNSAFLAGSLFLIAVVEGADRVAMARPEIWQAAKNIALFAESLLATFWLGYALSFARRQLFRQLSFFSIMLLAASLLLPLIVLIAPFESFFFSPDFAEERILFLGRYAYYFYLALLFFTVAALVQLERTLMSFPGVERPRIRFEVVGIGIVLVALLVYYSPALMYRTIDMSLLPVRSLAFLLGLCLCAASRFKQGATQPLLLSRELASRSLVALVIVCYFLLLGGVGQILRYFGGPDQRIWFVGLAVGGGLVLALILVSEKNRRKLNVFLHKHFYRQKYDYRNQWQMFTDKLSAADNLENLQDAILDFFRETFGRQGAALYLRDAETGRYRQKSSRDLDFPVTVFEQTHVLVRYFDSRDWVFNADDEHAAEFDGILRQFESFAVKLCVPLRYEQDLEGFLLLTTPVNPGENLTFEDYDLMKMLARQATSVLLGLKLSAQLCSAQEMAALGKVSTFVIHDLKNHVSNLSLMVDNAREHMANPEFQADMRETLEETVGKMKILIARLQNIREKKVLNIAPCDLTAVVRRGVRAGGVLAETVAGEPVFVDIDAEEIEKVVHNLVTNAREAGGGEEDGALAVRVGQDEMPFFEVSDQGCGMSEAFIRNRLFLPFQTTKPKGFGIGLYQCRQIVEAHGGHIEVSSKPGEGSTFRVCLPTRSS